MTDFERLYTDAADPYGVRSRWYERRKRHLLLASLPRERFAQAYEPGCGIGELTADLAPRCDSLLASDAAAAAVAAARTRTAGLPQVRVEQHALPADWPAPPAQFDLVVLSELGYFLDSEGMAGVAARCAATLAEDAVLVACDWLPDFADRRLPTADVHAALGGIGLVRTVQHLEDDFVLSVWTRDGRSVAEREGIRA